MTTVDSIGANYYAQQYPQAVQQQAQPQAQQPQQAQQAQQAPQYDQVSFSGKGEEQKKSHKGLKIALGLAITAVGAYFLHKNWKSVTKFIDGLIHPAKKQALQAAESINKHATTSAKQLDKTFNLDAAAKARRTRMLKSAQNTNWDGVVQKTTAHIPGTENVSRLKCKRAELLQKTGKTSLIDNIVKQKPLPGTENVARLQAKRAELLKQMGKDTLIDNVMKTHLV